MYDDCIKQRFWEKVAVGGPNECWPWVAATDPNGYGAFKLNGDKVGAHVASWLINTSRESVPEGKIITHDCDNKPCVNPSHLKASTYSKNSKEAFERGLNYHVPLPKEHHIALGEKTAKKVRSLKLKEAWLVKKLLAESDLSHKRIAKMFRVPYWVVSDISRGNTYKSVTYP